MRTREQRLLERRLLDLLDVADGAALDELRALVPEMSVAAIGRWLERAQALGLVEAARPGYGERWRLTPAGRSALDRAIVGEVVQRT